MVMSKKRPTRIMIIFISSNSIITIFHIYIYYEFWCFLLRISGAGKHHNNLLEMLRLLLLFLFISAYLCLFVYYLCMYLFDAVFNSSTSNSDYTFAQGDTQGNEHIFTL
jgi:hypothetical protein